MSNFQDSLFIKKKDFHKICGKLKIRKSAGTGFRNIGFNLNVNKIKVHVICCNFTSMDYKNNIESDASIMLGKPVIRGTRLTVELILKKMAEGATIPQLLEAYPSLRQEDIQAVLAYASDAISNETIISVA